MTLLLKRLLNRACTFLKSAQALGFLLCLRHVPEQSMSIPVKGVLM